MTPINFCNAISSTWMNVFTSGARRRQVGHFRRPAVHSLLHAIVPAPRNTQLVWMVVGLDCGFGGDAIGEAA